MSETGLPAGVEKFIAGRIDSVELLEVLINLQQNSQGGISADALSQKLYSSTTSIKLRLDKLVALGLSKVTPGQPDMYQYAPSNSSDDEAVRKLSTAYQERPVAVITAILARPAKGVQAFSDAFVLRHGDDSK